MILRNINRTKLISVCIYIIGTLLALILLPGAPVFPTLVGFTSLTGIVLYILSRSKANSNLAFIALTAGSLILAIGVIANIYYFTTISGGTCAEPVLRSDAHGTWKDMVQCYYDGFFVDTHRHFYAFVNACLMKIFGFTLVVPLGVNMLCLQSSLLLAALITQHLTNDKRTAALAIIASACICFYMSMATLLIKDAWVILATALTGYGMIRNDRHAYIPVVGAAVMLVIAKPAYLVAIAVGILIIGLSKPRETRNIALCLALFALCGALWCIPKYIGMPDHTSGYFANVPQYGPYFRNGESHNAFFSIIGDFFEFPLLKRILLLPVTAAIQFLIPFPWNFARDISVGYSQAYAHFAYPWYAFGITVVYYFIFAARRLPRPMLWLSLWALFCWLTPCVLHGGTVSRYILPTVTIFAPCVAAVLRNYIKQRSYIIWFASASAAISIVLVICYHLQNAAL